MLSVTISRRSLAPVLAPACLAAFLAGCGDDSQPPEVAPTNAAAPRDVEPAATAGTALAAGEKIYRAFCASCHGQDGSGGAGVPDLTGAWTYVELDGSAADLERTISHIRDPELGSSMPAYDGMLSEEELEAVARYVLSLRAR